MIASWQESYDKTRQCVKKRRHHFASKGLYSQGYGPSSSHLQLWELDHKEGRVPKNLCFWTVELEKTLESRLDSKEFKPVNLKRNQPWILIGRTDAEAEAPTLWPCDENSQLIGKDLLMGKIEGRRRRERQRWDGWMASQMQRTWLGQSPESGEGQACDTPWGWKRVGHNLATEQQQGSLVLQEASHGVWGVCLTDLLCSSIVLMCSQG